MNTTGDARLDFFGTVGSLRGAEKERITRLFSEAWKADPLFATKIAFYARDVRGGLGERQTFRTLLHFAPPGGRRCVSQRPLCGGNGRLF